MKNLFLLPALFVSLGLIAATTDCLHAATFNVTTANISGPGSLPVAIAQANATPGRNQIKISVTNVITLGLQLPTITNSVAIAGIAAVPSIISGGGALPLFAFAAGTTNSLSNLVLANGYTTNSGAAISNASILSVSSCVITNHDSFFGSGGAIINSGVMTISSSVISGNQADTGSGGAVYNSGTMALNKSQSSDNRAGNGGAIFNAGTLAVSIFVMSNNLAEAGFGGGIKHREMVISSQESVPTKIAIITSFAKELSLVFKKMAEIYSNRIDHINKYDFYGEMGRAAYTFIQTKNPKDMCGILSAAIFSGCEVFENNKR